MTYFYMHLFLYACMQVLAGTHYLVSSFFIFLFNILNMSMECISCVSLLP